MYLTFAFLAAICLPIIGMIPSVKKRTSPYRTLLDGVIAGAVGIVFIMILAKASGQTMQEELKSGIASFVKYMTADPVAAQYFETIGMSPEAGTESLTKMMELSIAMIPATLILIAVIASYFEYILLSKIMRPGGESALPMPPMRDFNLPRHAVVGIGIACLLAWILTSAKVLADDIFYLNIRSLVYFVFCLQGISVIFLFCYKRNVPKAIAVIITIFLAITSLGEMILLILGIADLITGLKARLR